MKKKIEDIDWKIVNWSVRDFHDFKHAYQNAVINKLDQFTFQDNDFVIDYAKYLIQYIETRYAKS
jgi:hypothetical protein